MDNFPKFSPVQDVPAQPVTQVPNFALQNAEAAQAAFLAEQKLAAAQAEADRRAAIQAQLIADAQRRQLEKQLIMTQGKTATLGDAVIEARQERWSPIVKGLAIGGLLGGALWLGKNLLRKKAVKNEPC